MAGRLVAITAAVLAATGLASADEPFRHARVRVVEPLVTLQSAVEAGAEEALVNAPFLPGDRIWTDSRGRIEFEFSDGSLLRVDQRSKLDYDGYDADSGGQVVLRLWSGSVFVHQRERKGSPLFVIETPSAAATIRERGVYRVDAAGSETRLSVYQGQAYLESDERVRVRDGERAFARRGERPWGPDRFDREEADAFARWDGELGDESYADGRNENLPEEVSPYAADFQGNGSWYFEAGVGNVWRPNVAIGWQPYTFGRWAWTAYGWTWVPNEQWGWATSHYGRWDYSYNVGWYWIPGNTWGPAWVSWSVSNDHVGWCPLGYGDRPVNYHGSNHGHAVPRGGSEQGAWNYVRRADLGARDVARRRVDPAALPVGEMHTVELARARVTREGRVAEGAAPRNIRTKPRPGDTIPELATDNMTTIPFPVARRKYESEGEERKNPDDATNPSWSPRGRRPNDTGVRPDTSATPEVTGWTRSYMRSLDTADGARSGATPNPEATPSPEAVRRRPEPARAEDGDREALRPWFHKLTRPRDDERPPSQPQDDGASARRRQPRSEDTPRAEPREIHAEPKHRDQPQRVSPSPPPPPPPPAKESRGGQQRAVRRDKGRDHQ
jgi:hypothetical protein